MKKILCALLVLGMTLAFAACGGNGDNGSKSSSVSSETSVSTENSSEESSEESSSEEDDWEEFIPDYTSPNELTEYFSGRVGTITYNMGKDLTIESLSMDSPIYFGAYSEQNVFTVDGGADFNRTLTVVGDGGGVAQANGGVLVLKNLTIRNSTHGFEDNYYRPLYAEFGGKVRFENCTIDCSIQLRNDAEAEFINCEVKSSATDMYGIWVADGSAKFDGCAFTGWRGLKVHEISGMDVVRVEVENCFFEDLDTKPAIAIDIAQEISTTTITFKNCEINNCANFKQAENVVGENGFYEMVVYSEEIPETFTLTATDCYMNGGLFCFQDGAISYPEWI